MFDLIQPEYQREGSATYYHHNDVSNTQLFQDMGSVRRVPIEAITTRKEMLLGESAAVCDAVPMPDYSALQNTATGELLDTRPIGKSYKLVPHDELFANHADILAGSDLPVGNVKVLDRIYDDGLRAHRTVHFMDLQHAVGDKQDNVVCRMDIFNSIDMSWAFQIFSGAYRDLCRNTLVFGGEKAYHQKSKHTKNLEPAALISKAAMGLNMWETQLALMTHWRGARLSDEQFGQILAETICAKSGKAAELGHVKPVNERLFNYLMHQFAAETRELGQTMWAAYNALTHWATHTNVSWTGSDGVERQTGKNSQNVHLVQRTRNDKVRDVITSPSWQYLESVAA